MTSSVGQETLRERIDEDEDGVADQAERDFEEDSTVQPSPTDGTAHADAARRGPRALRERAEPHGRGCYDTRVAPGDKRDCQPPTRYTFAMESRSATTNVVSPDPRAMPSIGSSVVNG